MPFITVRIFEGRTAEQKRELIKALTKETARICGCSEEGIYVVIDEDKKENWGIGGEQASIKFPDK